jgi:hypothetical protein
LIKQIISEVPLKNLAFANPTAAARKNGGGGIVTVRYERDVLLAVAVE